MLTKSIKCTDICVFSWQSLPSVGKWSQRSKVGESVVVAEEFESAQDAAVCGLLDTLERVCYAKMTECVNAGGAELDNACKIVDLMKAVGLI